MVNTKCKLTVLIPVLLFLFSSLEARHIIGGDIAYTCLGVDTINNTVTYEFEVRVYRDCFGGGAQFDPNFSFGIYSQNTSGVWSFFRSPNVLLDSQRRLDPSNNNPCIIIPPNVCVDEGIYRFVETLPIRTTSYMVAYQRCCRNNTITNIYDPEDQGAAYTIVISPEAQASCNNSPRFKNFPPVVICADEPLEFDHGAIDTEGDDLVYEFCTPLTAGGQDGANGNPCLPPTCSCVIPQPASCAPPFSLVQFRAPAYTSTRPLAGNPVVTLDQVSGMITGTPNVQGQFVVGVCVKEYRQGVLLTTLRRDFQFNVAFCEKAVTASIKNDAIINDQEFLINSCGINTIDFVNQSTKIENIQEYYWEFDINGTLETFDTRNATVTFPGVGEYLGVMILNRGNNDCTDTADIRVNIYPAIDADYEFDYDTCEAGPINFTDLSVSGSGNIIDWAWDFDREGTSSAINPNYQFQTPGVKNVTLRVTDINECEDEMEKEIDYFPVPPLIVVEPNSFVGCAPATISFLNLSVPIDSSYEIIWDFGDGSTVDAVSPSHTFNKPGTYSIKIDITSPIGCFTSAEFPNLITIEESPVADFTYSPDMPNNFDRELFFTDQSQRANSWQWNFDDDAVLFDRNPVYTFRDTGVHRVELIVVHANGCSDTITKFIDVVPNVTFHVPNAFTPNNDGKNDEFKGKGFLEGFRDFEMTIWNRWGEQVFLTNDPSVGWNGKKNNVGEDSPLGVYVYLIEYTAPRGERKSLKGYATLIR